MEISLILAIIGFFLAAWAVVGNDSVQTLGTFLASNKDIKWYWLFLATSVVMITTLSLGWYINGGDFSWGRLARIEEPSQITWIHVLAPVTLLFLTKYGIPVSTTFLVLSVFASGRAMTAMILQSVVGYAIALCVAFLLWQVIRFVIDENKPIYSSRRRRFWRISQWIATMFLWSQWLMHDMANIAIYLPRQMSLGWLVFSLTTLTVFLGIIFYSKGGRIQSIVMAKTNTQFVRSATIIDFVLAVTLLAFKQFFVFPLSTTWVFVGLLAGRELSVHYPAKISGQSAVIFPMLFKDFLKILVGLAISVIVALVVSVV